MKSILILCLSVLALSSNCRTVETSIPSRNFTIALTGKTTGTTLEFITPDESGKIRPGPAGVFEITTPRMDGGYSEFAFVFKYNVHDPSAYKIISLKKSNKSILELAISEIMALQKNTKGFFVLNVPDV